MSYHDYDLSQEEQDLVESFEKGEFKTIKNIKSEKKKYESYANAAVSKQKNINLRLSEVDLHKLKTKAFTNGMPYQTLLSSLVHKYVNGQIRVSI